MRWRKKRKIEEAPFEEPYKIVDEKPVGNVRPDEKASSKRGQSGVGKVLSGSVLEDKRVRRHYPFFLYCCLLVILYMGYLFACQRTQRAEITGKIELQNARSAALVNSSRRIEVSRHSYVVDEVKRRGLKLKEWNTPPKEIVTDERKR